jgi:hypothetical protein
MRPSSRQEKSPEISHPSEGRTPAFVPCHRCGCARHCAADRSGRRPISLFLENIGAVAEIPAMNGTNSCDFMSVNPSWVSATSGRSPASFGQILRPGRTRPIVPVVLMRQAVLTHAEIMTFDADAVPGFTGDAALLRQRSPQQEANAVPRGRSRRAS